MIWLAIGVAVGAGLALAGVVFYGHRLLEGDDGGVQRVELDGLLAVQAIRRQRSQTVQEMVAAERQIALPARHYFAVIDGQLVERTVPVDGERDR